MTEKNQGSSAGIVYEPVLEYTVLRACETCGAPHPGVGETVCPSCHEPVMTPAAPTVISAEISSSDPVIAVGAMFLKAGRFLRNLAGRM